MCYIPFKQEVLQRKTYQQIIAELPVENRRRQILRKRNKYLWAKSVVFVIVILCARQLIILLY